MFEETEAEKRRWSWTWPIAVVVLIAALAAIQVLRVNRPRDVSTSEIKRIYTPAGILISRNLVLGPGDFYTQQIDLNRRSQLIGSFRTPKTSQHVAVIVINESDLEPWRSGAEVRTFASTGYIPGGKINLSLSPGTYLLIIDSRQNEIEQHVFAEFSLDR